MQKTSLPLLTILMVLASFSVQANGDIEAGKQKSATCVACHGTDGNSPTPNFPKIAGQHASYLYKQLVDYKSGKRNNAIMAGIVASLTDTDMHDLAAFYASQKTSIGTVAEDQLALGQMIYRAGNAATGVSACSGCHSPTGAGNPQSVYPKLSGQYAPYTADQLKQFSEGIRANDRNAMMRTIAAKMTEQEMQAVAEYTQGLR